MKKRITEISMLTGDLYYDYVQPAAIAAGITEEVTAHHDTWGDYTTYHVDADAAEQIGHCMYCACMNAHIALHQYGSEAEARQMLYQLEVSIKYHPETAEQLATLRDAIAAMLPKEAPAADPDQQPTPTEEAPQATPEAPEHPTTDEQKEEDHPMSNTTERYDYLEHMNADVIDAIRERYTDDEIRSRLDDDRDELAQDLHDDLWIDDSVTGNASGSYYCNAWRAEEAIAHNWDLIADFIDEWDCADILRKGPEAIDVSIRCYLLGQAIDAALDQLNDEIPEAEEPDEDDGTNDADAISA